MYIAWTEHCHVQHTTIWYGIKCACEGVLFVQGNATLALNNKQARAPMACSSIGPESKICAELLEHRQKQSKYMVCWLAAVKLHQGQSTDEQHALVPCAGV